MDDFVRLRDVMGCLYNTRESYHIKRNIMNLPTYDVKPVVRGKWQLLEGGAGRCSNCKSVLKDVWDYDGSDPFCSECGADMREEHYDKRGKN